MYTCETCGKEFGHRGDFIKHVEIRKSPCVKDTKSPALIERLAAMEKAMNAMAEAAGIKLNVPMPIQQTPNMSFPLSKSAFIEAIATNADIQVCGATAPKGHYASEDGYFRYLKDFIKANKLDEKYNADGVKKLRKHADLDDIIKLYSIYDVMKALPAAAKIAVKQSLLAEYFECKFNKIAEEVEEQKAVEVAKVEEVVILPTDSKEAAMLKTMFARFEQQLRDSSGITGEKARDDIIALFVLRLLQPRFESGEINIMNIEQNTYPANLINNNNIKYCLMKNLVTLQKESMMVELGKIWRLVLSNHSVTGTLFRADKFLNIKDDSLLASMISELTSFNFEACDNDTLSDVYQHFIHKQFKGDKSSKLGQHFTPIHIVKFITSYVSRCYDNNHVIENGLMIDPFMGTGGFIMNAYKYMKSIRNDSPNKYLYGSEIDNDVFICAAANLVINTGVVCTGLQSKNAFSGLNGEDKNRKYSMILTNPPFGMKFTDKDSYNRTTWFNQAKIKNGNMVCLQYNMHILAPGGICSMVWPYGSECFSTSKKTEIEIRKRLFTEFDVLSVILLPKGTFEYTSISTVIITFRKPIQHEVVVPKLKIYQYKDGAKTIDELEILADVNSDKLRDKKYVIDPNAYKDIVNINSIRPIFEMKKLGDIFDIVDGKYLSKDADNTGNIPFYSCSANNPTGTHSKETIDRDEYILFVSAGGSENNKLGENVGLGKVFYVRGKSACMVHVFALTKKMDNINVKYVYYYLKSNKSLIVDNATFMANLGRINKQKVEELIIPIPPMEVQNEIVSIVERFEAGIASMQESIKGIEFQIDVLSKKQFVFKEGEFEMKKLKDLTDFMSTTKIKTSEGLSEGLYRFYNSSQEIKLYTNDPIVNNESVIIGNGGNVNIHYDVKFTPSKHVTVCNKKDGINIDMKYLYHYLSSNRSILENLSNGVALKWINKESMGNIDIPIPSAELQKQIANKFDALHENINKIKAMKHESEEFAKMEIKELFR